MAAGKIRGITIELGADTSGIGKALGELNSKINSTTKQLKDVERLLKLDPKNTELLRQKQELLNKAIADSKAKVDALKQAQAQLGDRTEENAKQYDAIEREIVSCTSEQKKWQAELDAMTPKAKTLKETLSDVSEATGKAAEKTKALSAAALAVGAGLVGNAYKAAQTADEINTLSKQYGIAVEEIQKMNYAQDRIDVSTDAMLGSFAKLTKQMGAGSKAFEELGVEITNTDGTLRDSEDVWYDTLQALSEIENETERDVKAQEVFGKSAAELAGIIDDGGEALRKMGQEAEDAGLILSGDALNDANQFNDAIDKLKATASQSFLEAGAALATNLVPMLEKLVTVVSQALQWFGQLDGTTQTIILTIAGLVAAISPVLTLVSTLTSIAAGLNMAMLPMIGTIGGIVIAIGAVIAIGVLLYKNWGTIKEWAGKLSKAVSTAWNNIKTSITNAATNAKNAATTAFNNLKTAVSNAATNAKNAATTAFNNLKSAVSNAMTSAKNAVSTAMSNMVSAVSNSSIVSVASSVFNNLKSSISTAFEGAKSIVTNAMSAIKSTIDGTHLDKDVHVNIYENTYKNTREAGNAGYITPYASAYTQAVMFNRPTVLPTINGYKQFGDGAGSELVIGTNKLMSMIQQASGGMTINMTVNGAGMNANEVADLAVTKITNQIMRRNNRW